MVAETSSTLTDVVGALLDDLTMFVASAMVEWGDCDRQRRNKCVVRRCVALLSATPNMTRDACDGRSLHASSENA